MQYLLITVTSRDWILIYSTGNDLAELYHLLSDPNQERNVITDHFDINIGSPRETFGSPI
ncbi:hypothetical protein DRO37_04340 [Candidatus Bathyarchaeota archaeon]|nr:MAG: hypothetical protein DRO37_04340 [Candidatus Bathyarchaeota archaeon]